jgi:hypothetical protein
MNSKREMEIDKNNRLQLPLQLRSFLIPSLESALSDECVIWVSFSFFSAVHLSVGDASVPIIAAGPHEGPMYL